MSDLKINLDVNELIRLYQEESKTIQDLSKMFNVNYGTIKLRLVKSGINLRTTSESKKIVMNRPEVKQNVSEASKKSQSKRKETNLRKYGTEVPAAGINWKDEYEIKHGVRHPNQKEEFRVRMTGENNPAKREEAKQKIKENRWENKSPEELQNILQKNRETSFKNFGTENPLQSEIVKNKIRETSLKTRGVNWPAKDPSIREKMINIKFRKSAPKIDIKLSERNLKLLQEYNGVTKRVQVKCLTCGNEFETVLDYVFHDNGLCKVCFPNQISKGERELREFIQSIISPETNIIFNDRKLLHGKELDIYFPDKKIAIEFNGIYYHSEKHGIGEDYHLNKTNECEEKGIKLIHIFEDEWYEKKEIVQSRLKRILHIDNSIRIHARKCEIREIDTLTKDLFLTKNHIQGKDICAIRLGAFYNNELVSVMTFSKGNIAKGSRAEEGVWELNRFCTDMEYNIPGIASKLLTYFKRNFNWIKIFSYCDRRWSSGNTYYKLNFNLEKLTNPNYWYIKGVKRIHRFNLRKRKDEPRDITEVILRISEGYTRVWDAGNLKFTMIKI